VQLRFFRPTFHIGLPLAVWICLGPRGLQKNRWSVCTAEIRRLHGVQFIDGVKHASGAGGRQRVCRRRCGSSDCVDEKWVESIVKWRPCHVEVLQCRGWVTSRSTAVCQTVYCQLTTSCCCCCRCVHLRACSSQHPLTVYCISINHLSLLVSFYRAAWNADAV